MPNVLRSLGHTLAALTANGGCFHRAWERNEGERWVGEWRSETNGHAGALRCLLRRSNDEIFDAMFHARYGKCLRVCYHAQLKATPSGQGYGLEGQADLGALAGGIYTYRGELSGDKLSCSYECRYDRGVFALERA